MREVQAGDYCGYSFAFEVTKNNTKLAVVDIGYGDGILRTRAKHEALINETLPDTCINDEPYVC